MYEDSPDLESGEERGNSVSCLSLFSKLLVCRQPDFYDEKIEKLWVRDGSKADRSGELCPGGRQTIIEMIVFGSIYAVFVFLPCSGLSGCKKTIGKCDPQHV